MRSQIYLVLVLFTAVFLAACSSNNTLPYPSSTGDIGKATYVTPNWATQATPQELYVTLESNSMLRVHAEMENDGYVRDTAYIFSDVSKEWRSVSLDCIGSSSETYDNSCIADAEGRIDISEEIAAGQNIINVIAAMCPTANSCFWYFTPFSVEEPDVQITGVKVELKATETNSAFTRSLYPDQKPNVTRQNNRPNHSLLVSLAQKELSTLAAMQAEYVDVAYKVNDEGPFPLANNVEVPVDITLDMGVQQHVVAKGPIELPTDVGTHGVDLEIIVTPYGGQRSNEDTSNNKHNVSFNWIVPADE